MVIHIISSFDTLGGAELRCLELFRLLQPHAEVKLWSNKFVSNQLPNLYPIEIISQPNFRYPQGGTMVFVGCYQYIGDWIYSTKSERTILVHNTPNLSQLVKAALTVSALGSRIEVVYASRWLMHQAGFPGPIHASPIDITKFIPKKAPETTPTESDQAFKEIPKLTDIDTAKAPGNHAVNCSEVQSGLFNVGRLSRDAKQKHHYPDSVLYERLAANGCTVSIMGGMSLKDHIKNFSGINLMPVAATPPVDFMQQLDCFYYRTSDQWVEPFGRVIMEAMACGLPVVAHRNGGYAEIIRHGENGFLFKTQKEALEIILALKNNPKKCIEIGHAARFTIEQLYSESNMKRQLDFFLGSNLAKSLPRI